MTTKALSWLQFNEGNFSNKQTRKQTNKQKRVWVWEREKDNVHNKRIHTQKKKN